MTSGQAVAGHAGVTVDDATLVTLAGKGILLSASQPFGDRGAEVAPYDPEAIARAVTSLCTAVLAAEGRLIFGGHPTISKLVLEVAEERCQKGSVDLYLSEWFANEIPPETERLVDMGYAEVHWVPAAETLEASLARLRETMAAREDVVGAVFVGGMSGVLDEYETFGLALSERLLVPYGGPGGAAGLLADQVPSGLTQGIPARSFATSDLAFAATIGRQHAMVLERARLLEAEASSRRETERAVARLELVSRASELLAVSLDYPATFVRLAELMVEGLSDLCLIDILQDDGSLARMAAVHADPAKQAFADVLRERYAPTLTGAHPVARVMRTGVAEYAPHIPEEFLRETTRDEVHFRIVRELGFQSFMCLPLEARGRMLGTLTLVSTDPERRYGESDLDLAREIARRAGVRIDNARLFHAEQRARLESETARERLLFLAEASRILSSSLDYDLTLGRLANLIVPRLADWCRVDMTDDAGQIRVLLTVHTDPEKVEYARQLQSEYPPDRAASRGAPSVIRTGKSELIRDVSDSLLREIVEDPRLLEIVRTLGFRSSMVVPLAARGRVFGAITFVSADSGRSYSEDDLQLAEELARRAAMAVDNARLYGERDYIARTLQRSLLPPQLPQIPGIELEARYYPMAKASDVGGDFYDVFEIGAGTWTIGIGDVCGKGPDAAAVMGIARYTLRAAAMRETRPSSVLRTISDVLISQVADQRFCTACCARLRPGIGRARLTISCGGHPLPIVIRARGQVAPAGRPGTLLGVLANPTLRDDVVDLDAGDAILFYTDGLLDERNAKDADGQEKLIALLAERAGSSASTLAEVLDSYVRQTAEMIHDDAAFVILRVLGREAEQS